MTDLPQTAISFAKECLGWDDVCPMNHFGDDVIALVVGVNAYPAGELLQYRKLGSVMAAAQEWCRPRGLWINTNWSPETNLWRLELFSPEYRVGTTFEDADLALALMAACVEAVEKLKAKS